MVGDGLLTVDWTQSRDASGCSETQCRRQWGEVGDGAAAIFEPVEREGRKKGAG